MDTDDFADNEATVGVAGGDSMSTELNDSAMSDSEASLLQQFSCMGTTDKDVLIGEFQRLLAPNLITPEGCAFFLDMNNWNLQQAICSYFDFDAPKDVLNQRSLPCMTFVKDVTIGEGEEVPPNTKFIKTWRILNSGTDRWPPGCNLRYVAGDQMSAYERILVDQLEIGHSCDVSIEMVSPTNAGIYQGQWRMATATGQFFGEMIWVIISVAEGGLLGLTQQMSSFHSLGSPPRSFQVPDANLSGSPQAVNPFGDRSLLLSTLTAPHVDRLYPGHLTHGDTNGRAAGMGTPNTDAPLVIHNINLDRLKATPTDDNQENCFKICNSVLTRSPSMSSPGASSGHLPFAGDQLNRRDSLTRTLPQQIANQQITPQLGPAVTTATVATGHFPPTPPPSEDMIQEDIVWS